MCFSNIFLFIHELSCHGSHQRPYDIKHGITIIVDDQLYTRICCAQRQQPNKYDLRKATKHNKNDIQEYLFIFYCHCRVYYFIKVYICMVRLNKADVFILFFHQSVGGSGDSNTRYALCAT